MTESDKQHNPIPPRIVRIAGPKGIKPDRTGVVGSRPPVMRWSGAPGLSFDDRQRETGEEKRRRILGIIASRTPIEILAPAPGQVTLIHRTTPDNAISIAATGLVATTLTSTTGALRPVANEQDINAVVTENAIRIGTYHHDTTFTVILQLPDRDRMPPEVRQRFTQYSDQYGQGNGLAQYNAYLEDQPDPTDPTKTVSILPPRYVKGAVNQDTGEFISANQLVAIFRQQHAQQ